MAWGILDTIHQLYTTDFAFSHLLQPVEHANKSVRPNLHWMWLEFSGTHQLLRKLPEHLPMLEVLRLRFHMRSQLIERLAEDRISRSTQTLNVATGVFSRIQKVADFPAFGGDRFFANLARVTF